MAKVPSNGEVPNEGGIPHQGGLPDRGENEARDALLDAAITLLAERGTYGVSLRAVARRAGVSYGLVHYYFATKNALLHQALRRAVSRRQSTSPSGTAGAWGPRVIEHPPSQTTVRAVFHLALDWDTYGDVFAGSPLAGARVSRLRELYGDDVDELRLRAAYAASFCLQMAWLVLAPQQLAAAHATPAQADEICEFVKEVVRAILPLALQPAPPRLAPRHAVVGQPVLPRPASPPVRATANAAPDARVALLDAATALLAERGAYGVSSRAVAKRAGVNYGLVHYYFATKGELLAQALQLELSRYQVAIAAVGDWQAMLIEHPPAETTWRSFVHLALDWNSYGDAFEGFPPLADARMRQLRSMYGTEVDDLRLRAAYITSLCLQIGWLVLAPQQLDAAGASPAEGAQIRDFVIEVDRVILEVARRGSTGGPVR